MRIQKKITEPTTLICPLGNGPIDVRQENDPTSVGTGINSRNKDGYLVLGEHDGYLKNLQVNKDGALIVRVDNSVKAVEVTGPVTLNGPVDCNPVHVSNMPTNIKVQEGLSVVQTPVKKKVMPINIDGHGAIVIPEKCDVFSIHLHLCEFFEFSVKGITGQIWAKNFHMDLFPVYVSVNSLEIEADDWLIGGGYVIYDS